MYTWQIIHIGSLCDVMIIMNMVFGQCSKRQKSGFELNGVHQGEKKSIVEEKKQLK